MKFRYLSLALSLWLSPCALQAEHTIDSLTQRLQSHIESEEKQKLRDELWQSSDFPKALLVSLLSHQNPALRNEALELLEEVTGNDFGFTPLTSPQSDQNQKAIGQWQQWAAGSGKIEKKKRELLDEDMHRYLSDIMSSDRDGFYRAIRRLEPFHLNAVGKIQGFIESTPQLSEGALAKLKQAQYQIVLSRSTVGSAATLARELTFGSRDQKLAAMSTLKGAGLVAIPILKEFLEDKDALVRETAVDAILEVGNSQVIGMVKPILEKETDSNVIHVALRKLKDIQGEESKSLVLSFMQHEDEDIVISSLKVYKKLAGSRTRYSISNTGEAKAKEDPVRPLVEKMLKDKRWRILSTALEYVAETKMKGVEQTVIELLKSDDAFVKANAIKAAIALGSSKAIPVLEKILIQSDDNTRVVITGLISMQGQLTKDQVEAIKAKGPDAIIDLINAHSSYEDPQTRVVAGFATHKEIDVACAALRALANSSRRVGRDYVSNILNDALKAKVPEKTKTILAALDLPSNPNARSTLHTGEVQFAKVGENKELNDLYLAFAAVSKAVSVQTASIDTTSSGGLMGLVNTLRELGNETESNERRMRIIVLLAGFGDKVILQQVASSVADLEPSERLSITQALTNTTSKFGLEALESLIDDSSAEIRNLAANAFFYEEENTPLVAKGLEYSIKPTAKISAKEMYGGRLSYAARDSSSRRVVGRWCRKVLNDSATPVDKKILALLLLRETFSSSDRELVEKFANSENPLLRRAAWHTYASSSFFKFEENTAKVLNDKSVLVRMAVPMALNKKVRGAWVHYFSDADTAKDERYDYNAQKRPLQSGAEEILRKLSQNDPSDRVRYESLFTLLCYGKTVDLDRFIELMVKQPASGMAKQRLLNYVESNYKTMGRGLAPLIGYLDLRQVSGNYRDRIMLHFFGGNSKMAFSSFAELAETVAKIEAAPQHVEPEPVDPAVAAREKVRIIYFYEKGCKECQRVESEVFPRFKKDFANFSDLELIIDRYDIYKPEYGVLNRALVARLNTPRARGKKPAVFSQAGVLLERDISSGSLMELAAQVVDLPAEDWYSVTEEEKKKQEKVIKDEFDALTLPVVVLAGLIDGINPCAFATIIFFLSYLQIAKRSPKEIFFVGCAFIFGVFLAYFSIGLVFHSLIGTLTSKFSGVKEVLNYVFAAVALVVAYYSFKDYLKARKGDLKGMSLQLPGLLKDRVRTVIRKSSKSTFFVLAAFVTGIVISFIELACTGQVYLPIIYQVQSGNHDAVFYLLCFNIAFVLPLVIIFGLAMTGMKSQALIQFQQKHTGKIKLVFTGLFLLLALMLLFNEQVGGWFIEMKNYFGLDDLGGAGE